MKLQNFLLTALILFAGVSGTYATKRYVGFSSGGDYSATELQTALNEAKNGGDTVCVATGLYLADDAEFTVHEGVTLIGGYNKNSTTAPRHYPGEFVPFDSSNLSNTTQFTILDGNAYKRSLASQKHRVVKVENNGVVDGCLIRNGHIRNGNGGGVFLNGGKLYNSIVRGNVAMNHPDSAEALGGGVFIQGGGNLINCLVAYNMANDGYGVAAGQGGGRMINNTITNNTYAPVFAKIRGGTFKMYAGSDAVKRPETGEIPKWTQDITLSPFYISRTLTTQGQFAVFCAAMDIPKSGDYGQLNVTTLRGLIDPIKGSGNLETRYGFTDAGLQTLLEVNTNVDRSGLNYADGVWYPVGDTSTVEYPMGMASWFGGLAYSVWLGGGLPSEAQWQFAARCNADGATVNDNLFSGAYGSNSPTEIDMFRILDTIAWVAASRSIDTAPPHSYVIGGTNRPHEVARKRPNDMGIYDMSGNVWEMCGDWYNGTLGTIPAYSSYSDPMYNTAKTYRVVKGGGFTNATRDYFTLSNRLYGAPISTSYSTGVRPIVAF